MRVDYRRKLNYAPSEFICFEHAGSARHKAALWWKQRSPDPVPDTAERRIIGYKLGALPEPVPASEIDAYDLDEVPF